MSQYSAKDTIVRKELFLDDRFINEMTGLVRNFCEPVKCPDNPVIRADRAWERDAAFVDSGLVIYDKDEALFKAWYQGGACYGPNDKSNMCYATSTDGIKWDKPSLRLVEFEGSKENNMVLMAQCMMHDPAVIIDFQDPDPQRRFKAIWWGGRKDASQKDGWLLGHCVGFSPDGTHWTEHPENPVWPGDAEVAVPFGLEHHTGRLVMYSSADGYGMRVVARTETDDFVNWDLPPKLIFQSDDHDPPGTEMGGMAAINYDGTCIGMLWVIRNLPEFTKQEWQEIIERNIRQGFLGPPIQMNATRCRIMYTELITSLDGIKWQRIQRHPLLPFGPEGSWDECISLAGRPFVAKDRIYIYYTGQGRTKQTPGYEKAQRIANWNVETGLATLRLDGFVSLEAGATEGVLVTKKFLLNGTDLCINANASNGFIKVEVLDDNGQPIPGFSKDEARPITGDELRAKVLWTKKSDVGALSGRQVRLRLFLKNAHLYSISVLNRENKQRSEKQCLT